METQGPQSHVARQVVIGHHGDVVKGQIQGKCTVCYYGNVGESAPGAVTGEVAVTALAGRPVGVWTLTLAQGEEEEEEEEEGEVKDHLLPHTEERKRGGAWGTKVMQEVEFDKWGSRQPFIETSIDCLSK